jgi:hypothetical protein
MNNTFDFFGLTTLSRNIYFLKYKMERKIDNDNEKDKTFIEIIESCSEYVDLQELLAADISSGFLQLTKARKGDSCISNVEDLRDSIEATISISSTELDGLSMLSVSGNDIALFCGLPPPALRSAKTAFIRALERLVQIAKVSRSINEKSNMLLLD